MSRELYKELNKAYNEQAERIYASRSFAREIPPEIGLLTSLESIYLEDNLISESLVRLATSTSFKSLNLAGTEFPVSRPSSLSSIHS